MSVLLFCQKCGRNHRFEPGQAERLVYALQAALADVMAGNRDHTNFDTINNGSNDAFDNFACLEHHAYESWDVEAYAEHCEGQQQARRSNTKKEREARNGQEDNTYSGNTKPGITKSGKLRSSLDRVPD